MVQLLLEALQGGEIECFHVDARVSSGVSDIGRIRWGKIWQMLGYCGQALRLRFRHGITHFYYVPADQNRSALYRDWLVMALCRPFFQKIIFHWHAAGLPDWLLTRARPWERWISRLLLWKPDLSIVIAEFNRRDAEIIRSRRIAVIAYGIPDPCPRFAADLLPERRARAEERRRRAAGEPPAAGGGLGGAAVVFKVLFIGLCHEPKGLFDAIEGIALANRTVASPFRFQLQVAGSFWNEEEKARFQARLAQPDLIKDGEPLVVYRGFVTGDDKKRLFEESDSLCFPTYYPAESFGLVLVEAMAFGLSIVTTRWRMIPEILPLGYPGIVELRSPAEISRVLASYLRQEHDPALREWFLARFTLGVFAANMKAVLLGEAREYL